MINTKKWELSKNLYKEFYKMRLSTKYVTNLSVGNSTIRAFGKNSLKEKIQDANKYETIEDYKPLRLFREWSSKRTEQILSSPTKSHSLIYKESIKSLSTFWKKKTGVTLDGEFLYLNYKLNDLYFKFLPLHIDLSNKRRKEFIRGSKIPLDKFVYEALWATSDDFRSIYRGAKTMGNFPRESFSSFELWHCFVQNLIKKEIRGHGGPSIIFDFYSWHIK